MSDHCRHRIDTDRHESRDAIDERRTWPEVSITSVDFHFDIMCPYAYQTSLWMRDVRDQFDLDVRWRFFSLEEINRSDRQKHPWERQWSYGWSMMRVAAMLRRIDPDLVDRWYEAAGTALHVEGLKPHRREVAEYLVAQHGLESLAGRRKRSRIQPPTMR